MHILLNYFYDKIIGQNKTKTQNLQYWREQIFAAVSMTVLIFGFFALVVSVLACISDNFFYLAVMDIAIYLSTFVILLNNKISLEFKKYFLSFVFYFFGVVLLIILGKIGAGFYWLFTFPMVAGILSGLKKGIYSLIINTATLLIIGIFLIYMKLFPNLAISEYDSIAWVTVSVNFIFLNAMLTIAIGVILRGLKTSMLEQSKLATNLTSKKELIQESNVKLRDEINKRIQTELDLRETIGKAESANIAKSEFLANMSHEIRTPLNAIIGFSDLLSDSVNSDIDGVYLKSIQDSSQDLLFLINKILDLSKIESDELIIKNDIVEMGKIFSDIKIIFEKKIEEKGLNHNFEIKNGISDFLILDEIRIKQILINLIDNALKFTEKGEINVSFEIYENGIKDKSNLKICVEDTGIGIPKTDFERIFESFWQIDGKSTRKYDGTGLGLTLVKKLTHLMKGEINLESTPGKGSKFIIVFENIEIPTKELLKTRKISKFIQKDSDKKVDVENVGSEKPDANLIKILQYDFIPKIEGLEEEMFINDVLEFAHGLYDIGKEHNNKPVNDISKKLITHSLAYDIQKIKIVLNEIREYFQKIQPVTS